METKHLAGGTTSAGSVKLTLNPPVSDKSPAGVKFDDIWVRAELADGKLSVKVFGQATYAGRTLTNDYPLDPTTNNLDPLYDMLKQIEEAYTETVKQLVLEGAYTARTFARNNGEEV